MGLKVILVTGPRRGGKSALISALVKESCTRDPHYIRLAASDGPKRPSRRAAAAANGPSNDCGVITATWLAYEPRRIFEMLPESLDAIYRKHRNACVLVESDTDPNICHAYPFDCCIFAMPGPADVHEVFRTPQEAQVALQSALHDTTAFAGEVYGLSDGDEDGKEDSHESRQDMSDSQIFRLLQSPLGLDLAARIQCQPAYHAIVSSDVVVVNTGVGSSTSAVDETVRRMETLVARSRRKRDDGPVIFCCDVCDDEDPRRTRLLEHLRGRYGAAASA
jgi:hypothetical protein